MATRALPADFGFVPIVSPTLVDEPPVGALWEHEIKYDGYRTQLVINGGQVRAYTRNGHDWSDKTRRSFGRRASFVA